MYCRCGYDRTSLQMDQCCPECGQLEYKAPKFLKRFAWAWRLSTNTWSKIGCVLSMMLLALGVANAVFLIGLLVYLLAPGFQGGTAGMALLFPPMIWGGVQIPATVMVVVILILVNELSRTNSRTCAATKTLQKFNYWCVTMGLCIPLVLIGGTFIYVFIRSNMQ